MVVDTSAIVAILFGEAEAGLFAEMIEADPTRLVSAASVLETALVVENELGEEGERELDLLLLTAGLEVVPFTRDHLRVARHAFRTFGKGRHQAGLNFGDCFSYALSKTTGEPLLFKGNDFAKTDVLAYQ
jgi:ribonuclease VapC